MENVEKTHSIIVMLRSKHADAICKYNHDVDAAI